jgi:hypothetical protein
MSTVMRVVAEQGQGMSVPVGYASFTAYTRVVRRLFLTTG